MPFVDSISASGLNARQGQALNPLNTPSMKRIHLFIISLCIASLCWSAPQFGELSRRADRFFDNHEWASAAACYNFMLMEQPAQADIYGRDIISNLMLNDTVQSQDLLKKAMSYKVPLDSVLAQVRIYAFRTGHSHLYEQFMLNTANANQWLARPLDNHLLKYYIFRCNAPKIIEYSQKMLTGNPDNTVFLSTLADGYLLDGQNEAAISTWQKILSLKPNDYGTLINIAAYYAENGDRTKADEYYTRAYRLRPTPYVATQLQGN